MQSGLEIVKTRIFLCTMHVSTTSLQLAHPFSLSLTHTHTQEGREKSILDKDKEAQALLEMASKPMHSAGLREPTEESEGEDS